MPLPLTVALLLVSSTLLAAKTNNPVVQMLVPGFKIEELPLQISNQNNLRFAPDGTLTTLGYDGKIWRLKDTNNDGLEDTKEPFWDKDTLSVPLGMAWTTKGLLVSSKGKISLLKDTNADGLADQEEILASGWVPTDVGSGGVDATAVTIDQQGDIYFGLLVADYANAYRLRKRKDLNPQEITWLKEKGRWKEAKAGKGEEDLFSLYDPQGKRGTIQKWIQQTRKLKTIATGIRVPVAMALNADGDLFGTDQEGETWMPNGNPFDELNHIQPGRNYGFPPAHAEWLPNVVSEEPVASFGPQHQSACGLVFNDRGVANQARPHSTEAEKMILPAIVQKELFGPRDWDGNAFVAGQSRGKIYRVALNKAADGYVGKVQTIARLSMLTVDLAISPKGEMYVTCHSGDPDWGTGPKGPGKIFKISYTDTNQPIPLSASSVSSTEVRVYFNKPLSPSMLDHLVTTNSFIEFGEYVSAGDQLEILKPPYAVVKQQDVTPRGRLQVRSAKLDASGKSILLATDPHPLAVRYALTLAGLKAGSSNQTMYLDYDLTQAFQSAKQKEIHSLSRSDWKSLVAWAPKLKSSGGTDSRSPDKPRGDWEDGRALFFSEKMQCSKCHRVRGEGGTAGPDLSNLVHRDVGSILRDIHDPNATIHPDYVTFNVHLKNGETMQGFMRAQEEASITLMDANGKLSIVPRNDFETIKPAEISLMPGGLMKGRSEKEVRDLLTFLMWEPPTRTKDEVQRILKSSKPEKNPTGHKLLKFVFVASKQDHGKDQHDYPYWQTNSVQLFDQNKNGVNAETAWEWPNAEQFQKADAIVFYYWNHNWTPQRLHEIDKFLERGGGIMLIHSSVIADKDPEVLAERIGLSAQPGRSGYRHMPFDLQIEKKDHPITHGMPSHIYLLDEPYWPLIGNLTNVQVLASGTVDGAAHPLIWTHQKGKGRVFASIPGHYTWTLNDPLFRVILMRALAWVSHEDNVHRFEGL